VSDAALQMIDATIIRAHHCAAVEKGGPSATRSVVTRGGFSTKNQRPHQCRGSADRVVVITPGQAHDVTAFPALMQEIDCDPEQMASVDKGYDSEAVRKRH